MYSVLLIKNNSAKVYKHICENTCHNKFLIDFKSIDSDRSTQGTFNLSLVANVRGLNSIQTVNYSFNILLYSFEIFFDDSELIKNGIIHDYSQKLHYSLEGKFKGYDISCKLYSNNTFIEESSFPIQINNGVSNTTYKNEDYVFIDHDIIKDAGLILILSIDSLLVIDFNEKDTLKQLKALSIIPYSEFFPYGECLSINLISIKGTKALFLLECIETRMVNYYSKESTSSYTIKSNNFLFILFDIILLKITKVSKFGVNHEISWMNVITSSSSCFIILCLDKVNKKTYTKLMNNNLIVYVGSWKNEISLDLLSIINFSTLNLTMMQINSADAVYISNPNCEGNGIVYLYLSDQFYGIRSIIIEEMSIIIGEGFKLYSESIFSLGICGSLLYTLSNLTYIHYFFIKKDHNLEYEYSFQPFYEEDLGWSGSPISCSSFYRPKYIAVYYKFESGSQYQLRIIEINSPIDSSYIKFIDVHYYKHVFKAKSRFISENILTVLNQVPQELSILNISRPGLEINSINETEYNNLIKQNGGNKFYLKILYFNSLIKKNSSEFLVILKSPQSSFSSDSTNDNKLIVICACVGISIAIIVAAWITYKKIIGRKKKNEDIENKSIIDLIHFPQRGRLGLLINHEDSLEYVRR